MFLSTLNPPATPFTSLAAAALIAFSSPLMAAPSGEALEFFCKTNAGDLKVFRNQDGLRLEHLARDAQKSAVHITTRTGVWAGTRVYHSGGDWTGGLSITAEASTYHLYSVVSLREQMPPQSSGLLIVKGDTKLLHPCVLPANPEDGLERLLGAAGLPFKVEAGMPNLDFLPQEFQTPVTAR